MDIRIIIRLHNLFLAERTGDPKNLAAFLGISVRSVYNYISFMKKELNAPIAYEVQKTSYCYQRVCELSFKS